MVVGKSDVCGSFGDCAFVRVRVRACVEGRCVGAHAKNQNRCVCVHVHEKQKKHKNKSPWV